MTIPAAPDDPEIAIGGDDDNASPSAPLLQPVTASIMPDRPSLISFRYSSCYASTSVEAARVPSSVTVSLVNGTGNIERTTNPNDGSLSVKVTTINSQPNGYREIVIEYFHIPTDMTSTVSMLIDEGTPPLSVYRTNMERQILPPSSAEVVTSPPQPAYAISPTTATTTNNNTINDAGFPQSQPSSERTTREKNGCIISSVIVAVAAVIPIVLIIIFAGEQTGNNSNNNNAPAPPAYPVSACNGKRTGGTPNWKDSTGDSCEWYERSSGYSDRCTDYDFTGAMGPAKDHCCYCLVTAAPTPRPTYYWQKNPPSIQSTTKPTSSSSSSPYPVSSCNGEKTGGTPEWKDRHGFGCDYYEKIPWYCKDVYHPNGNAIGSALDNCCACMIVESDPPSSSPVQSTPTVAPTLKPNQVSISLE